jgi:hypothetical protein
MAIPRLSATLMVSLAPKRLALCNSFKETRILKWMELLAQLPGANLFIPLAQPLQPRSDVKITPLRYSSIAAGMRG